VPVTAGIVDECSAGEGDFLVLVIDEVGEPLLWGFELIEHVIEVFEGEPAEVFGECVYVETLLEE
jgi:hypothetical protein